MQPLPIDEILPDVVRALAPPGSRIVLEAPPGAGKTTRVPRAMLDAVPGEILVLEPRRLAARLAARRVADELGEKVGDTVGYTVRFEDISGPRTRIRFVTEGVLTRRLVNDPLLRKTDVVLLDEVHERHLQGDVALAMLRRLQQTGRPDLRLAAMSATLDAAPIAAFLDATTLRSEGKRFDVAIEHLPAPDDRKLDLQIASAVRSLLAQPGGLDGHILVFLPGAADIRRALESCAKLAAENDLALLPLHGDLTPAEQDRAISVSRQRKVILSTNVAESSVTIDGVVAVVDSGLVRVARHAFWSGLPTTAIEKTSRASATQRAGRAGRTRPGRALRLYTKADHDARPDHDTPEILRVDLTQTWLELHAANATDIAWLDAPKADAIAAAEALLGRLGAITDGKVTATGRRMLGFPLHPRQARLLVEAERRGVGEEGCILAAIVGERDIRARQTFEGPRKNVDATERSDLLAILDRLYEAQTGDGLSAHALRAAGLDIVGAQAAHRAAKQLRRGLSRGGERAAARPENVDQALLQCVLAGFPDRVARRRKQGSRDLALAAGGTAEIAETSAVRDAPWIVAVDAEVVRGRTQVRVASEIEPEWLIDLFEDRIREGVELAFDEAKKVITGGSRMLYDALAIAESPGFNVNDPAVGELLFEHAKARGARSFVKPEDALDRWRARAVFAATQDKTITPVDDAVVNETLRAFCAGKKSFRELEDADLLAALRAKVGAYGRIDELAPERITLASGRSVRIEYDGKPPWVESYLQDFFGTKTSPRAGNVPVVLHLLAPNRRAVQVTTDLAGFWERHYPAIRKELMRKYPRHAWPEETTTAVTPKGRGGK